MITYDRDPNPRCHRCGGKRHHLFHGLCDACRTARHVRAQRIAA